MMYMILSAFPKYWKNAKTSAYNLIWMQQGQKYLTGVYQTRMNITFKKI